MPSQVRRCCPGAAGRRAPTVNGAAVAPAVTQRAHQAMARRRYAARSQLR